mgnify:CR=1 FL=1
MKRILKHLRLKCEENNESYETESASNEEPGRNTQPGIYDFVVVKLVYNEAERKAISWTSYFNKK